MGRKHKSHKQHKTKRTNSNIPSKQDPVSEDVTHEVNNTRHVSVTERDATTHGHLRTGRPRHVRNIASRGQDGSGVLGTVISIILGTGSSCIFLLTGVLIFGPFTGIAFSACAGGLIGTGIHEMMSNNVIPMKYMLICSGGLTLAVLQFFFLALRTGGLEHITEEVLV